MTVDDLLPCPFCGGTAEIKEHWGCYEVWGKHGEGCLLRTRPPSGFPSKKSAITAWNTRNAVMVARIATGEVEDEVDYATSKPLRGSAGGKARAQHLSDGERSEVAKAGARARWKKERSADMTSQDRLMAALFDNPQREHVDIKFFVLGSMDLTAEKLCEDAAEMLEQMDATEGDTEFTETFAQRDVKDFTAIRPARHV